VKEPDMDDWEKLLRLMKYLNGMRELVLTMSANALHILKWYVDPLLQSILILRVKLGV